MRSPKLTALLLLIFVLPSVAQSPDPQWRSDLLKWRADHAEALQKPENWLSLIGLDWLKPGDNRFGSAKDNDIQVNAKIPAHTAVFRLDHGTVTLLPPKGEKFPEGLKLNDQSASQQALRADDKPPRSHISIGTVGLIVLHRDVRYALRVWDASSAARIDFKGLHWYEPSPKYRVTARWIPSVPPRKLVIPTVLGTPIELPSPGVAEFTLAGKTLRIEPVLETPEAKQLFFILRDTTSTSTTYGAGRFLYTAFPSNGLDKPGELVLDFNRMENPPCAYTPYATCPLPVKQNRMPVAIPAGEKRYHD